MPKHLVLPFTEDFNGPKEFLKNLGIENGFDFAEDVAGGFKLALEQQWEAKTRYAVLIGDAPCHGHRYHGSNY